MNYTDTDITCFYRWPEIKTYLNGGPLPRCRICGAEANPLPRYVIDVTDAANQVVDGIAEARRWLSVPPERNRPMDIAMRILCFVVGCAIGFFVVNALW